MIRVTDAIIGQMVRAIVDEVDRAAVDVLVYSREDVEYWRDSLNYVLARALREGRVLYARS